MNIQKKQHNTLIIRELLPPPISLCNNHISSNAFRSAIPALLHQAHAFCGRAFALMCIALPLAFASCEKDVMEELTPMHSMFNESVNLQQATLDSITNFTHKFGGYVGSHPESRQDKYFDPTLQNLRDAAALYGYTIKETTVTAGITVNDEWDGETYIYF